MESTNNFADSFFSFLPLLFIEKGMKGENKHISKYRYLLDLIASRQATEETFVPVSNRFLRKVLRQPMITRIKNNLIRLNVIECNNRKRFEISNGKTIGKESYSYRITKKYYELIKVETQFNGYGYHKNQINQLSSLSLSGLYNGYAFSSKLSKSEENFRQKVIKSRFTEWHKLLEMEDKPEYNFINANALKLELNPLAYSWIDEEVINKKILKDKRCEFINEKGCRVVYIRKNRILTEEIARDWKGKLDNIISKRFYFSCSPNVNRVYYNVTALSGDLRKFLRHGSQELVCLDYSNFQPFLLIKFLREEYGDALPDDVLRFIKLTSNGEFYNEMQQIIRKAGLKVKEESFKLDFFAQIFFSSQKRRYKYRSVFDVAFPNVSEVITNLKKGDYKMLSVLLQRLESDIVISGVIRYLAIHFPDSFILPVHDAIICQESMEGIVKSVMEQEVKSVIGYTLKIKREEL